MNSRVERYHYEEDTKVPSRSEKNKELYNTLDLTDFSKYKPDNNVRVLNSQGKTIDLEKIKRYIETKGENEVRRSENIVVNNFSNKKYIDNIDEEKDYDINSVLEKAKEGRELYYEDEKYKKLRDTQFDILNSLNIEKIKEEEEEDTKFNTEEQTLIDLINTVTMNKKDADLLSELSGTENEEKTSPIDEDTGNILLEVKEEEKAKKENDKSFIKELDDSFYTGSMSFGKKDFEGLEEIEKKSKKSSAFMKIGIIFLVLLLLFTIYVIMKYVLNIF